jgi:hypothetical protein
MIHMHMQHTLDARWCLYAWREKRGKKADGAVLTKCASVRVRSCAGQKRAPENQRRQCTAFWDPLDVLRQLSARPNSDEEKPLTRDDFSTRGSTNISTGATALGRACKVRNSATCKECSSESSFVNGCCQVCGYVDACSSPSGQKFATSLTTPRQYREFFEYERFDPAKHKRGQLSPSKMRSLIVLIVQKARRKNGLASVFALSLLLLKRMPYPSPEC